MIRIKFNDAKLKKCAKNLISNPSPKLIPKLSLSLPKSIHKNDSSKNENNNSNENNTRERTLFMFLYIFFLCGQFFYFTFLFEDWFFNFIEKETHEKKTSKTNVGLVHLQCHDYNHLSFDTIYFGCSFKVIPSSRFVCFVFTYIKFDIFFSLYFHVVLSKNECVYTVFVHFLRKK